jgi:hypothetical protein
VLAPFAAVDGGVKVGNDEVGMSVDEVDVSVDEVGVLVDEVGVSVDKMGVSVDEVGVFRRGGVVTQVVRSVGFWTMRLAVYFCC